MLTEYVAAPVTIFKSDFSVDYEAIDGQAAYLAKMGIKTVFVCGTTGESMSLTVSERKLIAVSWRSAVQKYGLILVVHVGTSTPFDSVDLSKHAVDIGADAIAAMSPYFFKPQTPADVVDFLASLGEAAPTLPLYYYHIPSMTGVNIPVADILMQGASRIPSLRGAKFTDTDLFQLNRCVGLKDGAGKRYNILFGRDEMLLGALAIGIDAAVGSTYNLPFMRDSYASLWEAWNTGNITQARQQQARARDLVQLMTIYSGGPASLKAMLTLGGNPAGPPRPPLRSLSDENVEALHKDLIKAGFLSAGLQENLSV